jgi:iron complex outermembrane receptor protein
VPDKWFLTLGSKFEHTDFTGFEVEPSVRLQWHPDGQQMLWTSVSRAVRTPSRLENDLRIIAGVLTPFGPALPVELTLVPSPTFESEELIAYEAGYRRELARNASLDVAAFFNDYRGLATLTLGAAIFPPVPIVLPVLTTNDTDGEIYGIEATFDWKPRDNLRLTASQSFIDIELHGPPPAVAIASEAAETMSPKSQFSLRTQWDVTPSVSSDTMVYHVSPISGFSVDDYWRVDQRLGWKVNDQLEAALVGQNLFRSRHREFTPPGDANAATISRSVFGTLTWRF